MTAPLTLTRWPSSEPPSDQALEAIFRGSGLTPAWWSNAADDRYTPHSHPYHKVLYCARGSIRLTVLPAAQTFDLAPGDRLDIPTGTVHSAVVGPQGVACVEAARYDS